MSVVFFGLTPAEALAGVTRHAARALGGDRSASWRRARRRTSAPGRWSVPRCSATSSAACGRMPSTSGRTDLSDLDTRHHAGAMKPAGLDALRLGARTAARDARARPRASAWPTASPRCAAWSPPGRASYGINTGFGAFANSRISTPQLTQLQYNLVRSHACGVGAPLARSWCGGSCC
jgi:hypothetical protein